MLFDYLKDIFVTKKANLPLDEYSPFLINRWLSFSSHATCQAINETVNVTSTDKGIHYKLLVALFPKQKYQPKITYIKKIKKEETEDDNKQQMLANNMELSLREIKQMLELKEQFN